jgi:hypothetical protein
VSAAPVSAAPVSPGPVIPAPAGHAADSPAPVSAAPMSQAPVSGAPVSPAPMAPVRPEPGAPVGPEPGDAERYPLPPRRVPAGQPGNGLAPTGPAGARPVGSTDAPDSDTTMPLPSRPQPAVAAATTGADDESTLTRRVPGSHLADELRLPGAVPVVPAGMPMAGPALAPPVDRDPDAEQHELDALVAGFARGAAAAQAGNGGPGRSGATPNSGPTTQFPTQDPSPTFQFNSGTPNGAEPQNVERR